MAMTNKTIAIRIQNVNDQTQVEITKQTEDRITRETKIISTQADWLSILSLTDMDTLIYDKRVENIDYKTLINPRKPEPPAQRILRFKLKPGLTKEDLIKTGFTQTNDKRGYYFCKCFTNKKIKFEMSINIKIPKDMEPWDDVTNVDVLDEDFLQPYTPFYEELKRQSKNEHQPSFYALNWAIDTYNKCMSSLDILEKADITE